MSKKKTDTKDGHDVNLTCTLPVKVYKQSFSGKARVREVTLSRGLRLPFAPYPGMVFEFEGPSAKETGSTESFTVRTVYWVHAKQRFDVEVSFDEVMGTLEEGWAEALDEWRSTGWDVEE